MTRHIDKIKLASIGGMVFKNGKDDDYIKARNLVVKQLDYGLKCEDRVIYPIWLLN